LRDPITGKTVRGGGSGSLSINGRKQPRVFRKDCVDANAPTPPPRKHPPFISKVERAIGTDRWRKWLDLDVDVRIEAMAAHRIRFSETVAADPDSDLAAYTADRTV
jgi:hypothetical protein